ncbi:hypothetical protein F511_06766 [Dorcoceras hygrometricum]|uniref:Histidine-containing phosphotransfer protein n=1 Tax=Dorcoceras hygrometricum TaxID=472368 RepID=A0A2Z7D9N8_9LAMI|nr:hypothetical protein F511_06766 [Dorcoceras hygrometricum]
MLRDESCPTFFIDLLSEFFSEAGKVVKQMRKTLETPPADFDKMNELCFKLKGSAASIGACRISAVCSDLHHAIEDKSEDECWQVLAFIRRERKNLQSRLRAIVKVSCDTEHLIHRASVGYYMRVEKKLISKGG